MVGQFGRDPLGALLNQENTVLVRRLSGVNTKSPLVASMPDETKPIPTDEDDDEDAEEENMDALIDDLQTVDGDVDMDDDIAIDTGVITRRVSDEMLQTDPEKGLSEIEAQHRRRKYGPNRMKDEKENLLLKFLSFFVGPVQFVMEV
jgi:H+-transporting ATPase